MHGIRDQVFEVIVRQALAGAPWRLICAGPMQANGITEEEIQKEVDRRLESYANCLSQSEKDALERFYEKWEKLAENSHEHTLSRKDEIYDLVNKLYAVNGKQPPEILFMHSPATFAAALATLNNGLHPYKLDISELCKEQDSDFENTLLEELSELKNYKSNLGANYTREFDDCRQATMLRDRDFHADSKDVKCQSALANLETRKTFRTSFRQKFAPMLNRYGLVFDMAESLVPFTEIQTDAETGQNQFFRSQRLLQSLIWGFYTDTDMLANSFIHEVLEEHGLTFLDVKAYEIHLHLFEKAPWYSFFENYCFVGTNPASVVRDMRLRLGNSSGPAIVFADGYKVFALNGMETPRRFLENPETLTKADIDREENVEKRRGLIELYGTSRYLNDAGAKLIHSDKFGQLFRIEIPNDESLTMVKVKNSTIEPDGTYKEYFLRVPPYINTAHDAVAWTFNIDKAEEYNPSQES